MSSKKTFGPYSPVRRAGNAYFISGQVGVDPKTNSSAKSVNDQTKQALVNTSELIKSYGLNMNDIVKTTIFVTDMSTFKQVNKVYESFFGEPRPARSTVGVKKLPNISNNPILVEIEAIAYKGGANNE